MKVEDSVRLAIEVWELGETDASMLFACLAVDGTAGKVYPASTPNNERFKGLLRSNLDILGPMGMPGIDLAQTRFPVKMQMPKKSDARPDIADVVYGIHRCHHGHGDELPQGFELIPNVSGERRLTSLAVDEGTMRLSDRMIFGLLAVAVMSPANADQRVPADLFLSFGDLVLPINDWWGRAADFPAVAATDPMPLVTLDFGDWMDGLNK